MLAAEPLHLQLRDIQSRIDRKERTNVAAVHLVGTSMESGWYSMALKVFVVLIVAPIYVLRRIGT